MMSVEGYHDYTGGCSVHRGDTMSTLGLYHDDCRGYHAEYTGGYHEYTGGDQDACGGYREYNRECSVHQRDTISTPGDVQYTGGIP